MKWSTACPDWETRIREGRSLIPIEPLFPSEAEQALEVFKSLRIADAPGQPTFGEACKPWVFDLVAAIFGAYDAETGRRMIQEFFLLVSKKNTKSTLAAGIMMTAIIRNWRMMAEFLILAPTKEIANNAFSPASGMVTLDPDLAEIMHVQDHIRTITHRQTGTQLKVVAADSETVSGKKATGVLIDELWLFGKRAAAAKMIREATGGLASRPEGFLMFLSTQSDDPPAGVFKQKLDYHRNVRDGKIEDPVSLPVIYEFPQAMLETGAHLNPANFGITNPNLGLSVDTAFLERQLSQAENDGEDELRVFLAKHLNVEIGLGLQSDRWPGAEFWEDSANRDLTLMEIIRRARVITVGIDGGGLDDLLGLCILGRCAVTNEWLAWNHAWAHPSALKRRQREAPRYKDFEKDGDLTIVKAVGDDVSDVVDLVALVKDSGKLAEVGVDPAGIGAILDALEDLGLDEKQIVGIPQGWKLSGAIKTTERKLASGGMLHAGMRMMNWCVGNARQEPRGNAILITKQKSGAGKVDPLMATFNAVALMSMNPEPRGGRSFWDREA